VRIDDPADGVLYGFTVYVATSSDELLEVEEARSVHTMLSEVFQVGKLAYTFDPFDAMSREKARTWEDPGFPIYFDD
jgi:hypothetical protein